MGKKVPQKHGGTLDMIEPGEVRNPWGRPPKKLTTIFKEMKEAGFERVTKLDVLEAYEILLGQSEDGLKSIASGKDHPMIMRIVAKAMLSKKGTEMLERMLDRAHGRAKSTDELKVTLEPIDLAKDTKNTISKYAKPKTKAPAKRGKPRVRRVVKGLKQPKGKAGTKAG